MIWLLVPLGILALLLLPLHIGIYAAFSVFDGKVGVRVSLFGLPVVRLWVDVPTGIIRINGRVKALSAIVQNADTIAGVSARLRKGILLLSILRHAVRARGNARLLVGTYDEAYRWVPAALASMASMRRFAIAVHTADSQTCKGLIGLQITCALLPLLLSIAFAAFGKQGRRGVLTG